ncbi:YqcI/YcgG family-domain-containing protein [Hyaloscypha sp. PMI_1271]|nr:YqcI/YcgG family-domain-containing protein [Hyaloscypha sp. PMI_1271]
MKGLRHVLEEFISNTTSKNTNELTAAEYEKSLIVDKNQIEKTYATGTWQRKVYDDLAPVLISKEYGMKTFPCVYATKGYKSNDQRYVFIESDDPSEPRNVRLIGKALRQYLSLSRSCGPNTTLVAFLRGLRVFDTKPWPEDIPTDTGTNKWAFCFDGVPWFPAVLTPAHSKRQSRYTPNLVIVMQPKWIFDILFNTPAKRYGACEKVRALVAELDEISVSPDVAHYGEPGTTESRQYYLLDENKTSYCPYPDLV